MYRKAEKIRQSSVGGGRLDYIYCCAIDMSPVMTSSQGPKGASPVAHANLVAPSDNVACYSSFPSPSSSSPEPGFMSCGPLGVERWERSGVGQVLSKARMID
jgi:hypothetical protein